MSQPFTAASHHDVLVLLVQLAVLLLTARLLGELASRLGQPTVVGEILAGILLGPSLLSGLVPALGEWLVPHTEVQGYLLETISMLGVMFLMLITGLETDIGLIRRQARSAVGIALGGLVLPLALGFLLGQLLPDDLLVDPQQRFVFALFLATAMAISAIPVIAKVLIDLGLTRRDIGQTIIASAMIDDTVGWIILSIVIGIASSGAVSAGGVLQSVLSVLALMLVSFTLGRWLVRRLLNLTQERLKIRDKILSLVVLLMFVWGAFSQALGLEALLGAFVIGIVFSTMPKVNPDVIHTLESITFGIFSPIFFAVAGLKVSAMHLLEPRLILITAVIIGVATLCKFAGVYTGARVVGKNDHWTALFYGAGLNARGSMGIIVASIGLSLNVLTQDMFSMIVVMAVITSLMAPFIMRWALTRIQPDAQEQVRLRHEELRRDSLIANAHRVLMPTRRSSSGVASTVQQIEARILDKIHAQSPLALTLLTVTPPQEGADGSRFLDSLSSLFAPVLTTKKVLAGDNAGDLILNEAKKDYDLLVLGAPQGRRSSEVLFTPLVDYVMRLAPCPTILVHGRDLPENWEPRRILVPTNGSAAARRAAEVAFALAAGSETQENRENCEVLVLRVVEKNLSDIYFDTGGTVVTRQMHIAESAVEQLREIGTMHGVLTCTEVTVNREPEPAIIEAALRHNIDLIVLGTSVSAASDRLYLGPRVERILNNAPCPVIVVNA